LVLSGRERGFQRGEKRQWIGEWEERVVMVRVVRVVYILILGRRRRTDARCTAPHTLTDDMVHVPC
jgi:hypothetical protein